MNVLLWKPKKEKIVFGLCNQKGGKGLLKAYSDLCKFYTLSFTKPDETEIPHAKTWLNWVLWLGRSIKCEQESKSTWHINKEADIAGIFM